MFRAGYGDSSSRSQRQRWSKTGANYKARAVQGDVTINVQVNDNEPSRRIDFMNTFGDKSRMGNFTGNDEIDIQRGDPVFIFNQDSRIVKSKLPTEMRNLAIVGFNALPLMGARTREEFQRFFKFIGISKIVYNHQSLDQPENGISVQHRGATSVPHTGFEEFSPGDKISFVAPDPDPAERERVMKEAGYFQGIQRTQLRAIPVRVTYEQSVRLPERANVLLFRKGRGDNDALMSLRRLRSRPSLELSQREEFALSIKQDVMFKTWVAIAVATHYGLVTLNMPSISSTRAAKSLDGSLLQESLPSLLSRKESAPTVTVNGPVATVNVTAADTTQRAQQRREQLLWLGAKLDLLHDDLSPASDRIDPSQSLIDGFLGVNNAYFFRKDQSQRVFDVRRLLDKKTPMESLGKTIAPGDRARYAKDTFPAQMAKRQHDSPQAYYRSAITAKLFADEQVHAIALNAARPKEAIDVLL